MLIKELKYPWQRTELLRYLKEISATSTYDFDAPYPGEPYETYADLFDIVSENFACDYCDEKPGFGLGSLYRHDDERALVTACTLFFAAIDWDLPGETVVPQDYVDHPKWPEFEAMCKKAIALLEENDRLAAQQE